MIDNDNKELLSKCAHFLHQLQSDLAYYSCEPICGKGGCPPTDKQVREMGDRILKFFKETGLVTYRFVDFNNEENNDV